MMVLMMVYGFSAEKVDHKQRILILHSYSQEYDWTKLQHNAFVQRLNRFPDIHSEISSEYMDTKRVKLTPEYERFFAGYLKRKYTDYKPDAIYTTDDNALKFYMAHKSELFGNVPVFFSGINDSSLRDSLNIHEYTGVYETKDIGPNIELIKQFSPQTRDIWIVGDDSGTYRSVETEIRKHALKYPKYRFHYIASAHIGDVVSRLPNTPKSFVLLTTIGGFTGNDGETLSIDESIRMLKKNTHLILCSMEDAYIRNGVIGGYVTSGTKQGEAAAVLLNRYLSGEPLSAIHAVVKSPNLYMFDYQALVNARIILSEYTARNAVILHKKKTFLETYENEIFSVAFIVSVIALIVLITAYYALRGMKQETGRLQELLDRESGQLQGIKHRAFVSETTFQTGFWEWTPETGHLNISEGVKSLLRLPHDSGSSLDELVGMVHPGDQKNVEETIEEVMRIHGSNVLVHKVVTTTGEVKTVRHTLCYRVDQEERKEKLIGMVQVETR